LERDFLPGSVMKVIQSYSKNIDTKEKIIDVYCHLKRINIGAQYCLKYKVILSEK
jgi:hypothetical protein